VPLTLPSHASLFTGLEPGQHGVLDNSGYRLDAAVPTLGELLKRSGYATGGAVSAIVLNAQSGIARGFDFYDDRVEPNSAGAMLDFAQRPGRESATLLLDWIGKQSAQPFFAFLHAYEPHYPYEAPEPYRSRYPDSYDAEIAVSDAIVGEFLSGLKKSGVYDRSVIVFLSDHGEGLGEHGEQQHGIFLYRESIQVPLLIKLPKSEMAGKKVSLPVQLTDVFTTVGDLLGLSGFPARPGTVSLTALAAGAPPPDRRIFAENFNPRIRLGWSELRSLLSDRHQYIQVPTPEFYDLLKDPAEKENLVRQKPAELRSMVAEIEKRRTSLRPPSEVDSEQAKKLQSLGYLTGSSEETGGPLPDPKDGIASLAELSRAVQLHEAGKSAEAVLILRAILETNPRLVDAWEILSSALERQGQLGEALVALKKTVQLSPPGRTNYMVDVANLALKAGETAEAGKHAELAWEMGDGRAAEVMARVRLREKDFSGANSWAGRAIERKVSVSSALLVQARVAILEGKFPEALTRVDEALAIAGQAAPPQGAHVVRAEIFGRQDKLDLAEGEYRKELEAHPRNIDALAGLAIISAARGEMNEAARRIDAMLRVTPTPEAYLVAISSLRSFGNASRADALLAEAKKRFPSDSRLGK
jgi:tetratricopeptide (TPR) repeat protein